MSVVYGSVLPGTVLSRYCMYTIQPSYIMHGFQVLYTIQQSYTMRGFQVLYTIQQSYTMRGFQVLYRSILYCSVWWCMV
jgi:hypothetical protein